jgi:protein phosphatase
MKVVIMVGASGSGKSTWIRNNLPTAAVVSVDSFWSFTCQEFDSKKLNMAHAWAIRGFIMQCAMEAPLIVVDNTNTTTEEISPYIAIARAYGVEEIEILWFEQDDVKLLVRRNQHQVQEHTIRRHLDNMGRTKISWPFHWPTPRVVTESGQVLGDE